MLSKNQIKYIQSLHQKKYRQMYGYFLVEGRKSVEDLISSYFEIHTIYATNEWNGTSIFHVGRKS
jgi:TrmH family RNA methyltransferase